MKKETYIEVESRILGVGIRNRVNIPEPLLPLFERGEIVSEMLQLVYNVAFASAMTVAAREPLSSAKTHCSVALRSCIYDN